MEEVKKLLEAQAQAESKGEHVFICPNCGGNVWWRRDEYKGHLHLCCDGCAIEVRE